MQLHELITTLKRYADLFDPLAFITLEADGTCMLRNQDDSILRSGESVEALVDKMRDDISQKVIANVRVADVFGTPRGSTFGKTRNFAEIEVE